ncbi:hypothetical protein FHS48_000818 [Novispirillum itersonii]|uniref:Uncharacterized protein n=1 Tax=Novispirillum itersonii TaxID=189 RepID=A0A7X0DKY3_NOVIT|nr:hypothetical protein [Novispirillum itersonii]
MIRSQSGGSIGGAGGLPGRKGGRLKQGMGNVLRQGAQRRRVRYHGDGVR